MIRQKHVESYCDSKIVEDQSACQRMANLPSVVASLSVQTAIMRSFAKTKFGNNPNVPYVSSRAMALEKLFYEHPQLLWHQENLEEAAEINVSVLRA